jgi:hypothetical protein
LRRETKGEKERGDKSTKKRLIQKVRAKEARSEGEKKIYC